MRFKPTTSSLQGQCWCIKCVCLYSCSSSLNALLGLVNHIRANRQVQHTEVASFPGLRHLWSLVACSMQVWSGEARKLWSHNMMTSGRQRVDTPGVVPDHNNSCLMLTHPWCHEQQLVSMRPCEGSSLQPLDGRYKKGLGDPSSSTAPRISPPYFHTASDHRLEREKVWGQCQHRGTYTQGTYYDFIDSAWYVQVHILM